VEPRQLLRVDPCHLVQPSLPDRAVWRSEGSYEGAPADGSAWLAGEDAVPFRVMRGGWASATEFVCTSSARRQLRADAGSWKDAGDENEADESGWMAALLDTLYTPYGFRVICECP
jgi:hypothetical protein